MTKRRTEIVAFTGSLVVARDRGCHPNRNRGQAAGLEPVVHHFRHRCCRQRSGLRCVRTSANDGLGPSEADSTPSCQTADPRPLAAHDGWHESPCVDGRIGGQVAWHGHQVDGWPAALSALLREDGLQWSRSPRRPGLRLQTVWVVSSAGRSDQEDGRGSDLLPLGANY
jgi:hypothetical protein